MLAVLAVLVAACSVSGSRPRAAKPDGPRSTTAPTTPTTQTPKGPTGTLRWRSCDGDFQCASLRVPIDYAKPDGPTLTLRIARKPAAKPAQRIGSLLVNPGGPGVSAIELVETVPFPEELSDRFDIVGFDPRGVGRSQPVSCHSHLQAMYDADPTIEDRADEQRYLAISRQYVDECRRKYAALLPHLGTLDVARDMERVRQALGEEKLTYLGYSYGTSLGQQYAGLFPEHVRAIVLDGVVDPGYTGLQSADLQAQGFERSLGRYLDDCRSKTSCRLGPNPAATLDRVIAAAEKRPIPARAGRRSATPGVVELGIGQAMYAKALWPELTAALVKADKDHDGSGLVDLADQYLQRDPEGHYPNISEIYFAVSCVDAAWPKDPRAVLAAAKTTGKKYPRLGEGLVNDYVRCAMWPAKPQPLKRVTASGAPPILVISTTGDPATPYQSGVDVAKGLDRGVLLTNVGEGHTIFAQGKPCIDDAVVTYLVDLRPPRNGLRCS